MTSIEWTDLTWNPTTGCDRVSPGCSHCYALTLANRLKAMGQPAYQNDGDERTSGPGFALTLHRDRLDLPLRREKPAMWFVNSMSDLFHYKVPSEFVADVFRTMSHAEQHTFQILTKRPQRMAALLTSPEWQTMLQERDMPAGAPPNVWLGTSIESDRYLFRIFCLRSTPAAVRFLSLEPLLGPLPNLDLGDIDWVIVGGESGANARPMDLGWAREIRDQCVEADVPFLFKQWGGRTPKAGGRMLDGRTWDEYPKVRVA